MYDVIPVTNKDQVACGPTCLKMLLSYYGHDVPLDELISECGLTVAGCKATDIKRVGNAHGLDITFWRMDAKDVFAMDRPAIIHWGESHYVVFCGMDENGEPVISNPSRGRFSLPRADFEDKFSNVVLCHGTPEDYVPRATKAIAKGEYFNINNELCKAIAPIANGAMLTLNTNYTVTSVEAELAALNQ